MADDERTTTSELGTKAYWDAHYARELENFASSQGEDQGVDWFSETIGDRLVDWITEWLEPGSDVLDIGCGNGAFLFALEERLKLGDLVGIDYSPAAVDLASQAAKLRKSTASFRHSDLRNLAGSFALVHDKGTFDAFMLGENKAEVYIEGVLGALAPKGYFVVTSCNFTSDELERIFAKDLVVVDRLPHPTFRFGGVDGAAVATLAFQRR